MIDDGSNDTTLRLAKEWQSSSELNITVVSKVNGGVSSARNAGIVLAKGKWLAFIDSDDILGKDYFAALAEFSDRDRYKSASMLTSRSILYLEDKGTVVDNHPLSWKYKRGDRLVDLNSEPHVIHLGGHSSVVQRSVVVGHGIIFNKDVKPAFEDADFVGRYLSHFNEPILGLVSTARYYYRKRSDGSSLMDTTWSKAEKFTHEPNYGHLGMLDDITRRLGYTPRWAQNMVLYSLYWYFAADKQWNSPLKEVPQSVFDEFWHSLDEIFKYIESDTIRIFSLMNLGWYLSEGILRHFKNEAWTPSSNPVVYRWGGANVRAKTIQFTYSFSGTPPDEEVFIDGELAEAVSAKTIRHMSFGRTLMYERILVVPSDREVGIKLDGRDVDFSKMRPKNIRPEFLRPNSPKLQLASGKKSVSPQERIRRLRSNDSSNLARIVTAPTALLAKAREEAWVTDVGTVAAAVRIVGRFLTRQRERRSAAIKAKQDHLTLAAAKDVQLVKKYASAWLFVDRPNRADDNAEHLYRFVWTNHPEINAWFMLTRESPDWARLESEGFKLVPYGEESAIAPVLNARFIISSHADADVFDPIDPKKFGVSPARRIFLQHGMNMNDISKWLNTKKMALMLTSSKGEYDDFTADGGLYRIGKAEVRLTGLPRHDQLVRLADRHPINERKLLLVVPTWRKDLADRLTGAETSMAAREILTASSFYAAWNGLLSSPAMEAARRSAGLDTVFVLHDHLAEFGSLFDFGPHVRIQKYSDMSVQDLLTRSRLVVTDYSSIGTEAAISGAAVVYYQYDAKSIYGGSHSFKQGWFDYEKDGFGPVCQSLEDFESFLSTLHANQWQPDAEYSTRLNDSLPFLDGSVCARVVEELLSLE